MKKLNIFQLVRPSPTNRFRAIQLLIGLIAAIATTSATSGDDASKPEQVGFAKRIRPIFVERCLECHGPDKQEGGLRLDRRGDALKGGDSGEAIKRNSSATSLLVERLVSDSDDERMPLGKKPLPKDDIDAIRRWIDAGAEWPDALSGDADTVASSHWSFQVPRKPKLPESKFSSRATNPIDAFVFSRLEREQLTPAEEADSYSLIRRVYVDLIGIPPTPEEADDWLQDSRPDAYERLVDRLLASPQYGERWARRWLDLARYADTNGYEKDRPRSIWPYRDWVVRALNSDLPFDQFSLKQLAGDMLPNATSEDRIATGFHRNTMLNEEGGIDPLEFRFHAMVDRVGTTGTTWLGLTIACAQCHTHKYDPITHHDYYQFMALLNNADEPELELADEAAARVRQAIESQIDQLTAALPKRFELPKDQASPNGRSPDDIHREVVERRFQEWLQAESSQAVNWLVQRPDKVSSNLPLLRVLDDGSVLASGDQTKSDKYQVSFNVDLRGATALRLEALPHESLPLHGPGRAYYEGPKGDFFLSELRATVNGQPIVFNRATHDYSKLAIGSGENGAQLTFDGNTTTGWSTKGREGEPHAAVYTFAAPHDLQGELTLEMIFERHYSCGLGRFRISLAADKPAAEARGHTAEIEQILAKSATERTDAERDQLFRRFLEVAPELTAARTEIERLRESLPKPVTTLVFAERADESPRPTHLHHRGEFLQPKDQVTAAVPRFLPALRADSKANRLALARWLFAPENPMTARVTVNRHWQAFFGRGMVRTTDDFGLQGELPSHPDLLDWLACEFSRFPGADFDGAISPRPDVDLSSSAWSLKRLHRMIVTSATYRQSSRIHPALFERDPNNVLLARGPRGRLDAEMIRDTALHAADLLSLKMGGPGVFPPQPASVTTEGTYGALPWTPSIGEDRYRRGLYTYMKRTAPFALHLTFDAPSGEACVARRDVSNSPLQALALLNDVILLEAAQGLGRYAVAHKETDDDRATLILRRCLTRPPTSDELQSVVQFARHQRERFTNQQLDAKKLAGEGPGDPIECATWTAVSRAVLNLHESIAKQ